VTGPAAPDLTHVDAWVFDLDNTLYPSACDLFVQIDERIMSFVSQQLSVPLAEARVVQKKYYAEHGTTLSGLMKVNGLAPQAFLDFVHDIDLAPLDAAPDLSSVLAALPGKRYVFTNGSRRHAENVTRKLKIDHLFDDMFDIIAADYRPKPHIATYDAFLDRTGVDPARAVMFEDLARNLLPAHQLGMTTVLVRTGKDWSHEPAEVRPAGPGDHPDHVHHATDDLSHFLGTLRRQEPDGS
jgi:putative hydrolase of the HAD superfamily